ncbi:MAG: double-strand break repair protein AddB, partial [Rhodospirillaceae bacterium]|nr:double-strand break repair protein AddB [Rhodospirillaceae bacterium]
LTGEPAALLGVDAEMPPAVPELRRRVLLARLLMARPIGQTQSLPVDHAMELAGELGRLLDQVQTERLDFDALESLVPDAYAAHWQETLGFLKILTETWPAVLEGEGAIDPADRRNRLLQARGEAWRRDPPRDPVIAAGSTGSIPATADLLATVAGLPSGYVVLPGLDRVLDTDSWANLDSGHPQFGLRQLLQHLEADRMDVGEWPSATDARGDGPARERLIGEALRPAATTQAWRDERGSIGADALREVVQIEAQEPHEEAGIIALVLREALEAEGRTAALITPDRGLARRVASIMGRWGVDIDDSAGTPLAETPPGIFLRLAIRALHEGAAPIPLLSVLKHPLAACGRTPGKFRAAARELERLVLRGPRPASGFAGLRAAAQARREHALGRAAEGLSARDNADPQDYDDVLALIDRIAEIGAPLAELQQAPTVMLPDYVRAHIAFCEALAASDEMSGADRLWSGDAGEALATFVSELLEAGSGLGPVPPARYPALFDSLLAGRMVRPRFGAHPRLAILGPLEARLQHFDVTVLGSLNEGSWPPDPSVDPWMGRTMRADFGLPSPERRIGLSAHDFAQAFCAGEIILTRSARVDGAPSMPSRWLTRLDVATRALDLQPNPEAETRARAYRDWWRELDGPGDGAGQDTGAAPLAVRPRPSPPVAARPRRLSVTQIETWMRDPYAIYAREVLKLRALPPLDQNADAAIYGSLIHDILDAFLAELPPGPLPADAGARLHAHGADALAPYRSVPAVWTFWWPRFQRIADWVLSIEAGRRARLEATHMEVSGAIEFDAPGGRFRLTARADRIDELVGGGIAVIDFKTGAPPSKREVQAGFAPQLPLEAAMVAQGGFSGVPAKPVEELAFWRLSGGREPGQVRDAADDPAQVAAEALDGVKALVARFDDPATAYEARPRPDHAPAYSDYEHLARVKEWASGEGEG